MSLSVVNEPPRLDGLPDPSLLAPPPKLPFAFGEIPEGGGAHTGQHGLLVCMLAAWGTAAVPAGRQNTTDDSPPRGVTLAVARPK